MQTHSKPGKKLNPDLALVSGRIYTSDEKRYTRLILWIWRMQKSGHSDEAIKNAMQMAEKHLKDAPDWWAYLTKLMTKARAKAFEQENDGYKKEDLTPFQTILKQILK